VLTHLREYRAWAEVATGQKLAMIRTDGGGEFINDAADAYLRTQDITRQVTPAYTPQHNGVAERANRTILNSVRCMLHRAGLSGYLWPEAVRTAVYIRNRSPSRTLDAITPYQAWTGTKPSITELRVFGCTAHVHVPAERRSTKLSDRSVPCIHVGYSVQTKAYRLYNPTSGMITVSRDVVFEEDRFADITSPVARRHVGEGELLSLDVPDVASPLRPAGRLTEIIEPDDSEAAQNEQPSEVNEAIGEEDLVQGDGLRGDGNGQDDQALIYDNDLVQEDAEVDPDNFDHLPLSSLLLDPVSTVSTGPRRSNRGGGLPSSRARDAAARHQALSAIILSAAAEGVQTVEDDPVTFSEAMSRSDSDQWETAMEAELDSIHRTGTWVLTDLPKGRQAIGCKWVFKIKRTADGSVDRYKARLVAKGFSQKEGVDYKETFAPVAKFTSIRLLLALAAQRDYEIHQMDVKTAFLHGDLDVDIYMRQPQGFVQPGQEDRVCLLKKSLYGLRQAGRAWYHKIDTALSDLGFAALASDHCIYVQHLDDQVTFIVLYVDDLLLISNSLPGLTALKAGLSDRFEMTDLGEAQFILGLQLTRDRSARTLSLSQADYIRRVVERYGMAHSNPAPTPLATGAVLSQMDCPAVIPSTPTLLLGHSYASVVGALMYAMLGTRPDLAFAVGALSRFNSNPGVAHWTHLKRVLRYLAGTINHRLTFGVADNRGSQAFTLGYCDADWATSTDDRRSTTGWVFMAAGGAISWQSQRQKSVALSTVEAEYMAECQAAKEAVWLRALLNELGLESEAEGPTTILTDSQGAMALAKNPEHHQRSKHIDIRYHFVREQVAQGSIELVYIHTSDMAADQLTKPLSRDQHVHCVRLMGLQW
jgi:hypothetical protein